MSTTASGTASCGRKNARKRVTSDVLRRVHRHADAGDDGRRQGTVRRECGAKRLDERELIAVGAHAFVAFMQMREDAGIRDIVKLAMDVVDDERAAISAGHGSRSLFFLSHRTWRCIERLSASGPSYPYNARVRRGVSASEMRDITSLSAPFHARPKPGAAAAHASDAGAIARCRWSSRRCRRSLDTSTLRCPRGRRPRAGRPTCL